MRQRNPQARSYVFENLLPRKQTRQLTKSFAKIIAVTSISGRKILKQKRAGGGLTQPLLKLPVYSLQVVVIQAGGGRVGGGGKGGGGGGGLKHSGGPKKY